MPKCLGDTCSHCPKCGRHSFAAADGRCLYCHPVAGGAPPKPKAPKPRATKAPRETIAAPSLAGTLLEQPPTPAPTLALPTEADLIAGRVLACLECGSFVDHDGKGDGVRCECGAWATKRGARVAAHRSYGTPLPAGVVDPKDSEGGEHHATGPGKPGGGVVQGDEVTPPATSSPLPALEFAPLEFEPVANAVPANVSPERTEPDAAKWVTCPGGCGCLKRADLLERPCRVCGQTDAERVAEDRPGITGNSSPRTSVAAAMTLPTGKRRVQVLGVLARHRVDGRTAEELEAATGLGGSTIRPRLLELERDGFVERTDLTRPTRSGMQAVVWGVTAKGSDAADRLAGRPAGMP